MKKSNLLIGLLALFFANSCSKEKDDLLELMANQPAAPPAQAPMTPTKDIKDGIARYYYPFTQHRDPFAPLLTAGGGGGISKSVQDPQIVIQNFSNLDLKGIIKDREGKIALIGSKQGESFILKAGRVYDKRNRKIQGVTGIIKENSVVLVGQNKTAKEFFLRRQN